jgi:hypothetical protein
VDLEGADFNELEVWRTSANETLKRIGRQRTTRNTTIVNMPPMSITTLYGRVR